MKLRRIFLVAWLTILLAAGTMSASAQYSYEHAIYDACARHGCSAEWLISVLYCESGGDHSAIGPNGERGVFQIDPRYWEAAWYGPYEQIEWTAMMFASGHSYLWACA